VARTIREVDLFDRDDRRFLAGRMHAPQGRFNAGLRTTLAERGMIFNEVDQAPFRARMTPVYAAWRGKLGSKCWTLLEGHVGRLG